VQEIKNLSRNIKVLVQNKVTHCCVSQYIVTTFGQAWHTFGTGECDCGGHLADAVVLSR